MSDRHSSAAAETPPHAQTPDASSTDDIKAKAAARAKAIIEAQLARKKGGGASHGPGHDNKGGPVKAKGRFAEPPARPGQRGRRG